MNFRLLAKILGLFAIAIGLLFIPSVLCAVLFQQWREAGGLLISIVAAVTFGLGLHLAGRHAPQQLYQREALALVGLAWILAGLLGALPYICTGVLGPLDAVFESVSGFTTTGASVITDIEAVPESVLFWRSFTHFVGGIGIVVLFIAVLPYLGAGGKQLFKSESPGPDPRGLRPRIKASAILLFKIYFGLTVLLTLALWAAGMTLFEAICHSFSTLATGGFSTRNASIASYDSALIESIIIVFMVAAGTNFGLYFYVYHRQWLNFFRDSEFRAYLLILTVATGMIALNLMGVYGAPERPHFRETTGEAVAMAPYDPVASVRASAFAVVSLMTSTGFATDNFDDWPHFSRMLLVILMFVGGCAGSTGGGLKVVRVVMLARMVGQRVESTFRPKTVRALRISGQVVDEGVQKTVLAFFALYVFWFAAGTLFMSGLGLPFVTAATAVVAMLNNTGPGFEAVGPMANFSAIPGLGKAFLCLCMILGRLELFTVCVMFLPGFWRSGR